MPGDTGASSSIGHDPASPPPSQVFSSPGCNRSSTVRLRALLFVAVCYYCCCHLPTHTEPSRSCRSQSQRLRVLLVLGISNLLLPRRLLPTATVARHQRPDPGQPTCLSTCNRPHNSDIVHPLVLTRRQGDNGRQPRLPPQESFFWHCIHRRCRGLSLAVYAPLCQPSTVKLTELDRAVVSSCMAMEQALTG